MKTAIIGVAIALIAGVSPAFAQLYIAADYANLHEPNSTVPSATKKCDASLPSEAVPSWPEM